MLYLVEWTKYNIAIAKSNFSLGVQCNFRPPKTSQIKSVSHNLAHRAVECLTRWHVLAGWTLDPVTAPQKLARVKVNNVDNKTCIISKQFTASQPARHTDIEIRKSRLRPICRATHDIISWRISACDSQRFARVTCSSRAEHQMISARTRFWEPGT